MFFFHGVYVFDCLRYFFMLLMLCRRMVFKSDMDRQKGAELIQDDSKKISAMFRGLSHTINLEVRIMPHVYSANKSKEASAINKLCMRMHVTVPFVDTVTYLSKNWPRFQIGFI